MSHPGPPATGMRSLMMVGLVVVLAGCASGSTDELVPFVDSHVHLNDERLQIELMGRYGVKQAVISPERATYRRAWDADDASLLQSLVEMLASGHFRGIGEISAVHFPSPGLGETDYDPTGPTMRGIMALARRHRVPVMVHVS